MKFRAPSFVLLVLLTFAGPVGAAMERPNIVFVLFDDFGWGQPPSNRGDSSFKTPSFDRLARGGMRFTDAHSAAASCTPTRYGLLTGRYPSRIGQFGVLNTYSGPIIPKERLTVASFLKRQGYHTACIGKWHLGLRWAGEKKTRPPTPVIGTRFKEGPNTLGFDYFYGFTHARNIGCILEQDVVVSHVEAVENQPLMMAKALEYIDERSRSEKQPFFLYFPMCPPHKPITPAPEFIGKGGSAGKGGKYADWVYQGDYMLGLILDTLDKKGLSRNTLVIATGDNGAAGRPYPPLRADKGSIYEGGHREPFAVRWPGRIKSGSVCSELVCLNDLLATCGKSSFRGGGGQREYPSPSGRWIGTGEGSDCSSSLRWAGHPAGSVEADLPPGWTEGVVQPAGGYRGDKGSQRIEKRGLCKVDHPDAALHRAGS
ncbi:MAG: sulfatase-like hydrolase/transferase [Roseibacillus sp.]|nr:sulfatase-like hydrolase/transferase [Roseibacillus sp.]